MFLERLTNGRISLYYYRDKLDDHYLVDKAGIGLSKLQYRESEGRVNGRNVIRKSTSHILLLNYYMQDWPQAPKVTADLEKPRHDNLIRLLEQYHAALGSAETFDVLEKGTSLIALTAEMVGEYTRYNDNDLEVSVEDYPRVGVLAHIWMPRVNRKLYFRTGVLYSKFTLNGVSRTYYKFPVQLEYIYPSGTIRPRISYGPNFTNLIASTVSGHIGAMARLGKRAYLTAGYEIEFDEEYVVIPVAILSHSVSVGFAVRLSGR